MQELIQKVSKLENSKQQIKQWCLDNNIQEPLTNVLTIERISQLYKKMFDKYASEKLDYSNQDHHDSIVWHENQLSLFHWTVIVLSLTSKTCLTEFKNPQFDFLSSIFKNKQNYIIQYEVKCMLFKGKQKRKNWSPEEQEILQKLIQKNPGNNKWNQIARQLYKNSNGLYFRQGKHCLERWMITNGLMKLRNQWCLQAQIQLLQLVNAFGRKWKQVAIKFSFDINRLDLKRRLKTLFAEVGFDTSNIDKNEKEIISYLLKTKNLELNKIKKQINSTKLKKPLQNKIRSNSSKLRPKSLPLSELGRKQNCFKEDIKDYKEEYLQDKLEENSLKMRSEGDEDNKEGCYQTSKRCFDSSNQFIWTMWNVGFVPVQSYPYTYKIFEPNLYQTLNYNSCERPWNLSWPYLFL